MLLCLQLVPHATVTAIKNMQTKRQLSIMRNISISITHSLPITNQADELRRKREAQLRQFVFFQLRVHLKSGCDLVAMDKNGKRQVTSDK